MYKIESEFKGHISMQVNAVLGLILALGNLMNSGNKVRGQCDV